MLVHVHRVAISEENAVPAQKEERKRLERRSFTSTHSFLLCPRAWTWSYLGPPSSHLYNKFDLHSQLADGLAYHRLSLAHQHRCALPREYSLHQDEP
jgi:hypothetical protein